MDLFEQVLHAVEGEETEGRIAYSADGQKSIQVRTFGPDRWVERAKMGRLDAINFLAVILFAVQDTFNLEQERRIVEEWAKIIRAAAMGGEMTPRDPVTLLPLKTLPDGWDWLVSLDDADTFVKAQGMGWSCTGIVEHLATQSTHPSIALMEQNPQLFTSKHVSAPSSAISSGAPESAEPPAESGVRKEGIAETPSRTTEKYKASWPTCTKHELIDCFLLTGKNWEDTLSRPSKYDSAKSQPGRKGKGGDALWFPITFAGLLVQHEEFTQSQVKTRFLKIAEWKKWESELLAEIGMI